MVESVVQSTIAIYNEYLGSLRPTPHKSHYTSNLRNLSPVFQGMLSADPHKCETGEKFSGLWIHETAACLRIVWLVTKTGTFLCLISMLNLCNWSSIYMFSANPRKCTTVEKFSGSWVRESCSVFKDRKTLPPSMEETQNRASPGLGIETSTFGPGSDGTMFGFREPWYVVTCTF